jgi:hypothetical protein
MRKLSGLLLAATLVLSAPAMAQEEPRSSPWAQWFQWLFGLPADESPVTVAHPRALGLAAADQAREQRLQQEWRARQFAEDKAAFLRDIRAHTYRQIAVAVANKAPAPPFRPPSKSNHGATPPANAPVVMSPSVVPMKAARPKNTDVPRSTPTPTGPGPKMAAAAEKVVSNIGQSVFGRAGTQPVAPGLFVLALVGIFVVPAAGIALILIGFAHLRGHSFLSGSIITILGGLLLWGTIALATRINPDLVAETSDTTGDPSENEGPVTPMDALRSGILWSSQ